MSPRARLTALGLMALGAAIACSNAGDGLAPTITGSGAVSIGVFLDRDGSGAANPADTVVPGAKVGVIQLGSGSDTAAQGTTGLQGEAVLSAIPLGRYRAFVTEASLGDSLEVQTIDPDQFVLTAAFSSNTTPLPITIQVGYPAKDIREIRQLPPGKRVFLTSVVTAGAQTFGDSSAFVFDSTGSIRLTAAVNVATLGNNPGDSIRALGTTATFNGEPVLNDVKIFTIGRQPAPIPFSATVAQVGDADGGALDATFVVITGAIIADTQTVAPNFKVVVKGATGDTSTVLLSGYVGFVTGAFPPGRSLNARGVLAAQPNGRWVLAPRSGADITFNN